MEEVAPSWKHSRRISAVRPGGLTPAQVLELSRKRLAGLHGKDDAGPQQPPKQEEAPSRAVALPPPVSVTQISDSPLWSAPDESGRASLGGYESIMLSPTLERKLDAVFEADARADAENDRRSSNAAQDTQQQQQHKKQQPPSRLKAPTQLSYKRVHLRALSTPPRHFVSRSPFVRDRGESGTYQEVADDEVKNAEFEAFVRDSCLPPPAAAAGAAHALSSNTSNMGYASMATAAILSPGKRLFDHVILSPVKQQVPSVAEGDEAEEEDYEEDEVFFNNQSDEDEEQEKQK